MQLVSISLYTVLLSNLDFVPLWMGNQLRIKDAYLLSQSFIRVVKNNQLANYIV